MMLNYEVAQWPSFTTEERDAVDRVLASNRVNYWTGEEARAFEREFAEWSGSAHAVALANGTLALDLALKVADLQAGDEIIVTPRTFIASISTAVNAGAVPVFADIDRDSGNITAETIAAVATDRTRAIIPVHLGGWPCEMASIMAFASQRDLFVVEDCAQAHGAMVGDRMVGSIGHVGAWSFCQDKIMTTGGEGGMVTTNSPELWSRMWAFKDHGKSWDAVYNREHLPGFRWLHESFGTNWRMMEMQAAIGRIQLKRMTEWRQRRAQIALAYHQALQPFERAVRIPLPDAGLIHAYYRFYAYVRPEGLKSGWSRDRIIAEVNALGVPLFHGSCPEVYMEKAFQNTGWRPTERLPNARELGETSLMFLTHPTLSDDDVGRICHAVSRVLSEATS